MKNMKWRKGKSEYGHNESKRLGIIDAQKKGKRHLRWGEKVVGSIL